MKKANRMDILFGISMLFICIFLFWGVRFIPFHPDETSLLYQSRDFEKLFSDPLSLRWNRAKEGELDQTYRELNPPLPKYILAIGRILGGFNSKRVSVDWNWSRSWEENEQAGALPPIELLEAARSASTIMLLSAILILYFCGKWMKDRQAGYIAALAFGTHALVLLHGRRAMAEGTLLFSVSLVILGAFLGNRRPWLAGLSSSLAACSKLSAAALFPFGLLSVVWSTSEERLSTTKILRDLLIFITVFGITFFSLNPLLWTNPLGALKAIYQARLEFLEEQIDLIRVLAPDQVLDSPLQRLMVMLAHLFIASPQMAEAGNYSAQTSAIEKAYLAHPLHNLLRGMIGGAITLSLTALGMAFSFLERKGEDPQKTRMAGLLFAGTLIQSIALLWANPLPFQRYYVPLIPFICLWIGTGGSTLLHLFLKYALRNKASQDGQQA
jgi:4-amino-4-deoxy-L-arabinose transferase-like glycosyltransferase